MRLGSRLRRRFPEWGCGRTGNIASGLHLSPNSSAPSIDRRLKQLTPEDQPNSPTLASSTNVFPACDHNHIDPTRPQKTWRTAWRSLTRSAGLNGFRFHDLRHQAVTELAESGASDVTIMALAGHLSREMMEHYSHVRMAAKRSALEKLECGLMGASQSTPEKSVQVVADAVQ